MSSTKRQARLGDPDPVPTHTVTLTGPPRTQESSSAASPAPAPAPPAERPTLLANLVVNGVANFKVVMRDTDDYGSTEDVAVTDAIIVRPARDFNNRYELRFIFITPTPLDADGFRQIHRGGRLVIDGERVVSLGPLEHLRAVQSAVLLDQPPRTLRFEVFTTPTPVLHPSEELLADHVLALLEMDEYGGSVSSSHLQNQVRELPFYPAVIEGVRSSWLEFINAHPDKWRTFKYTQEEIEQNKISVTCRTKELRVFAVVHQDSYRRGDIARERIRVAAEAELHETLLRKLEQRPYEQSELLSELVNERSFLTLITLNLTKILAMFEEHPDEYFVLCDELHPIAIEARRAPDVTELPGGLVYDRVRRRMVPADSVPAHRRSSHGPSCNTSATQSFCHPGQTDHVAASPSASSAASAA